MAGSSKGRWRRPDFRNILGGAPVVMLAGGYVVAVGTPCLCADVNGFMLGGGLVMIIAGAAMLLWSKELARLVIDKLTSLATQGK